MHVKSLTTLLVICWVSTFALNAYANETGESEVRRGQFDLTFTPAELLDATTLANVAEFIDADEEITWKLYVPESYDPTKLAGLLVYIPPIDKGYMPTAWQPVVDDQNLIWISANDSGNDTDVRRRMLFAVLGTQTVALDYRINSERVYLAGFSGGGKVTSKVAIHFANLFKGAIYICGAELWNESPPPAFEQIKKNRYVFLSGDKDFNLDLTKDIFRRYKRAGLTNIDLIIVPQMAHRTPDTKYFGRAVSFLDEQP